MRLEALELLERREIGVLVVEVDDEAHGNEVLAIVIEERAAAGGIVERPAERMLDETRLVLFGRDLPQLLEADAELLRIAVAIEGKAGDELLGERAARALGNDRVLAPELHAAGEVLRGRAVAADTHVARRHADDAVVLVVEDFGGGKPRIDLDTGLGRLLAEPAAKSRGCR